MSDNQSNVSASFNSASGEQVSRRSYFSRDLVEEIKESLPEISEKSKDSSAPLEFKRQVNESLGGIVEI